MKKKTKKLPSTKPTGGVITAWSHFSVLRFLLNHLSLCLNPNHGVHYNLVRLPERFFWTGKSNFPFYVRAGGE